MTRPTVPRGAVLLLLLALLFSGSCAGGPYSGAREAMADAMVRMMEAMGLFDPRAMGDFVGAMPLDPLSAAGQIPGMGQLPGGGGMPWGAPGTSGMGEMMKQFPGGGVPGMPGGGWLPWSGGRLEGIWEGRNGELLIVQGNRFRIYPGHATYVEGDIRIAGDHLTLHNRGEGEPRAFEYAESEGRLVLRDPQGQLYLYRRLQLGEEPAAAR